MWRALTLADAPLCAALHQTGFAPEQQWDAAFFSCLLQAPLTRGVLASNNNEPQAFILWQHGPEAVEIFTLVVAEAAQRQGLARQLIDKMCQAAVADGLPRVLLDVAVDNAPALALYEKCGFQTIARRPAYYTRAGAVAVDALVLERTLSA